MVHGSKTEYPKQDPAISLLDRYIHEALRTIPDPCSRNLALVRTKLQEAIHWLYHEDTPSPPSDAAAPGAGSASDTEPNAQPEGDARPAAAEVTENVTLSTDQPPAQAASDSER